MELAYITVNKIIEMFFILMIGAGALKAGIADSQTSKKMSAILLHVISPCVILMSYQIEFEKELLIGLAVTAGLSAISFLLAIFISKIVVRSEGNPDMAVERMSLVYSNCGFIGIPLINELLGAKGVFFMTAYITVFNILIWSHGIMLMGGKAGGLKETLKNLAHPSTVAIGVGLVFFVSGVRLPDMIGNPLSMIGAMNTPAAMLISGMNLAESELVSCLKSARTYMLGFVKLIVIPLVTLLLLVVARADRTIGVTILTAVACPSGAMSSMFALQYGKDSQYASKLLAVTTALSLLTIPVVMMIGSAVL